MSVEVEIEDSVATVTLNRPEKLNALSEDMKLRLVEVFTELRHDDSVRAVVLTGAGRGFCAGGDVQTMNKYTVTSGQRRLASAHATVTALAILDKPVIASVRGPVAGIGWSMAMACDMVIASDTTVFYQSFKHIGLLPDGGAIYFLLQSLGPAKAKELIYFARPFPAAEALEHSMVNRIVPDADLEAEAGKMALELADGPTLAFSLGKKLFRAVSMPSLQDFLQAESWAQGLVLLTDDHEEGASAFVEKRKPQFQGR